MRDVLYEADLVTERMVIVVCTLLTLRVVCLS